MSDFVLTFHKDNQTLLSAILGSYSQQRHLAVLAVNLQKSTKQRQKSLCCPLTEVTAPFVV